MKFVPEDCFNRLIKYLSKLSSDQEALPATYSAFMGLLPPQHWSGLEPLSKTKLVATLLKRQKEREEKIEKRKEKCHP